MAWDQDDNGTNVIIGQPGLSVENYEAARSVASNLLATAHNIMIAGRDSESDGGGGVFTWDPNSLDNTNDGTSLRPNDKNPGDPGRLIRNNKNPLNPKWFGAKGDGITNDTAAFNATFNAGNNIFVPPGTYLADIVFNEVTTRNRSFCFKGAGGFLFANEKTIIKATGVVDQVIRIGDTDIATPGGSRPMQGLISDILIDGNAQSLSGFRITAGTNITLERVTAYNCKEKGFFTDGLLACDNIARADLNCITYKSCVSHTCGTGGNDAGFAVIATGPVIGSFDQIKLDTCQSQFDYSSVRISGGSLTGINIDNGLFQPPSLTGSGITIIGSEVSIKNSYVETGGGETIDVSSDGAVYANVNIRNSSIGNPKIDANSKITYDGSYGNAKGISICRYTVGNPVDDSLYGPPNGTGKSGAVYKRGFEWKDYYGITWICVESGIGNAAKFVPKDGKVILPLPYTNIINGNILWWAQDDLLLRDLTVVTGGTRALTYGGADPNQYIALTTFAGGDTLNLIGQEVAGVSPQLGLAQVQSVTPVIKQASKNAYVGAIMNNKQELYLVGSPPNVAPAAGNYIKLFVGSNPPPYSGFTAGTSLIVLDVYPLRLA